MLRTHTSFARGLALGLAAAVALTSSPVALAAPAKAKKSKTEAKADRPDAGDANIPDAPDPDKPKIPPPMVTPATPGPAGAATPATTPTTPPPAKRVNKGSLDQGLELSDQADAKFDAGDYAEAARLYTKTLQLLSENDTNHITRSIVLANGVTSYEYLYSTSGDLEHLRKAQILLQDYLKACKTKHGVGCDRYPETQEARARLKNTNEAIDRAAPLRPRIPPEIDAAPGGKSYDLTVDLPPAPQWIGPAFVGGVLMAAGGTAVIFHGATADAYGPIVDRSFADTADTADTSDAADTGTADTDTGTTSPTLDYTLSAETKGKLLIGLGAFMVAAGIGIVALSARALAKHRRINKSRSQRLAVTPSFGRSGGGLVITGRF